MEEENDMYTVYITEHRGSWKLQKPLETSDVIMTGAENIGHTVLYVLVSFLID